MKHTAFHNHCIWKLDQVYTPVPNHTKNRIGRTEALSLLTYRTASLCREHPMNLFILWAAIWDKLEQDQEIYEEYIGFCADGVDGAERMAVGMPSREKYLEVWKLTATKQGMVTLTYMTPPKSVSDRILTIKQEQECVPR